MKEQTHMGFENMAGKTIARVTTCAMMGRNAYREWQSWTQVNLHFTDGTSQSFAEDGVDVYDVTEVEYVSPADLQRGDRFFDWSTGDTWHTVDAIRRVGSEVFINDTEAYPDAPWSADGLLVARGLHKPESGTDAPAEQTHTLVYERDIDAEEATKDHTELAVHQARQVLTAAMNELESAALKRVSVLVKRVYPMASRLRYDGEENEDSLLHVYVREILDAEGNALDSQDDPSDAWEKPIDEAIEPLLWEVSERDQSYYGEGRTLDLDR